MAEIKIKKKSPVWPWIIVVVVILTALALAYYFMVYNRGEIEEDKPNIGQDERIENGTGQNSRTSVRHCYYRTIEAIA